MIKVPSKIYVATQPINLRLSFDRLAGLVREQLGGDPCGDAVFVFHNKRRTHMKLLWRSEVGYCIFYTRLDRRTFRIPLPIPEGAPCVQVTAREMRLILEGLDRALLRAARKTARSV